MCCKCLAEKCTLSTTAPPSGHFDTLFDVSAVEIAVSSNTCC